MVFGSSSKGMRGEVSAVREMPFRPASLTLVGGVGSSSKNDTRSLHHFLADLTSKLDLLSRSSHYSRDTACEVFDVLTRVLKRETGTSVLDKGMGELFHQLWGGGEGLRRFSHLYYTAQFYSLRDSAEECSAAIIKLLAQVGDWINWYGLRKTSLVMLEEEYPRKPYQTTFFAHRILPDSYREGRWGFEVATGIRLVGLAGRDLWLKVYVREGGRFIRGTHTWVDQIGLALSAKPRESRVCGAIPVFIKEQRVIVDEARVFLPYSALQLESGAQMVDLFTVLVDGNGHEILSLNTPHTLHIPSQPREVLPSAPSAQSRGAWSGECISGDCFSRVFAKVTEDEMLSISCDIKLNGFHGEPVTLRCEFLDEEGSLVPLNEDSALALSRVLGGDQSPFINETFSFDLPLSDLLLKPGVHEITIDLGAFLPNGYQILGTQEHLRVRVTCENTVPLQQCGNF